MLKWVSYKWVSYIEERHTANHDVIICNTLGFLTIKVTCCECQKSSQSWGFSIIYGTHNSMKKLKHLMSCSIV